MKRKIVSGCIALFFIFVVLTTPGLLAESKPPRVFLYDAEDLALSKSRLEAGDETLQPALDSLLHQADRALQQGPWSVMDKPFTPPGGDKHDYMSVGPYWWPNPDTEDGLPYIRKDGLTNPERELYDRVPLEKLTSAVKTLSLAYYFTDHELYAARAAGLIRVWFLDDSTRMNPNLNYGQAIPGITIGRGIGIIDTYRFAPICDAIRLLELSGHWTDRDHAAIKKWFDKYLHWLLTSDHGKDEAAKENNHGTFYDIQTSRLAFFVGREDIAEKILSRVPEKRIAVQIEPDGRQPLELSRTSAFGYSSGNLRGLFRLAMLAEHVGLDLWHFRTTDGRSIRAGLEFLLPFALQEKEWPYQMIHGWRNHLDKMYFMLRIAAQKYQYPPYEEMIDRLPRVDTKTHRFTLLYPKKEIATQKQ
ncbi:hypothetical protein GF407_05520 [candidate division KSB1 bacterium]|nr:hypothetical protein [candidate division KSB1 bacterium]